jgi:ubiquinone/menaquinone biosynthesis C-methylase UbiE
MARRTSPSGRAKRTMVTCWRAPALKVGSGWKMCSSSAASTSTSPAASWAHRKLARRADLGNRRPAMAQNIYDDPAFFAGYSKFRRSTLGLDGAAEWPAMRALLPPMQGLRVLDLGCGFGWFSRWAREAGAASALGVDVSEKMLARARADTPDGAVTYLEGDLDQVEFAAGAFDLAYSSLALHYVADIERLFGAVRRALAPGGRFVFSTEHPIYMAPSKPAWASVDGRRVWPLESYLREGPRSTDWIVSGVTKRHRTIGTTLNALIGQGFVIRNVEEWRPDAAAIAANAELEAELDRPMFLLVAAELA